MDKHSPGLQRDWEGSCLAEGLCRGVQGRDGGVGQEIPRVWEAVEGLFGPKYYGVCKALLMRKQSQP